LAGVVALGSFLVGHLFMQTNAVWHAAADDYGDLPAAVGLHGPWRALVLIPLAFHVLFGLVLLSRFRPNVGRYPFGPNWTYTLQRVTAVLALAFLLLHAVDVVLPLARGTIHAQDVYRTMTARLSATQHGIPWWALGYMLGIGACAYHFGAGLRSAARSLGLVTTRIGLQRWGLVCALIGFAALLVGANTTVFLATGSALDWPFEPGGAEGPPAAKAACPEPYGATTASTAPAPADRPGARTPRPTPRATASATASQSPSSSP
jgi:succinate dehydrogenase / fumarate reductase cytochrome b subunit